MRNSLSSRPGEGFSRLIFLTIQAGRCPVTYADLNKHYGWRNVRIIVVIIYGNKNIDLATEKRELGQIATEVYGDMVEVRCHSLAALAAKFGVDIIEED